MTATLSTADGPGVRNWLGRLARAGGPAYRAALALPVAAGALLLPQAWLIAHALHQTIVERAAIQSLALPLLFLGLVLGLRIALGIAGEILAARAAEAVKARVRSSLISGVLGRSPTWTAARSSGAIAGSIVEHIEAIDGYLTRYLPAMAQAALLPLAFAAVMLPIDWMVALLLLVAAPLIPLFMALAGWGAEAASRRQAAALSRLGGHFADRLRGITTLKLFGRAAAETEAVGRASEDLRVRTMRVMRIAFLSSAVLEFFAALGVAGIALYVGLTFLGLVDLRGRPLTLEAGLFCLLMAPDVFQPLRLLAAHYHDRAAAKAAAAEIAAIHGELPSPAKAQPIAPPAPLRPEPAPGVILASVSVATPTGRPVLTDADLAVAAGEHIAVLGASGSGKSTLLEAIAGLRPHTGLMQIGGEDLAEIEPGRLLRRIGMLGQRPTIFAGSLADNIRLGRPGACPTAVRRAAQRARVTDFLAGLPDGLDTELGEGGAGLSGGEIQRVALARLYLLDRGLLLLDEPTAHLDPMTESSVLEGICEFARGRTLIVATHSAAVAARMDRCVRIAGGRLLPTPRPASAPARERGVA